jgi:hypothetical protein
MKHLSSSDFQIEFLIVVVNEFKKETFMANKIKKILTQVKWYFFSFVLAIKKKIKIDFVN